MSKYSREFAEAQMRAAPRRVTYACSVAWLLGIIMALRVLLLSSAPLGKSILFAALMLFNFVWGGMSVLSRSRLGYALLAVFAALPLFGSFAASVHLLALVVTGEWRGELHAVAYGIFGIAQMVIIIYLFRNMFSKKVLAYVWKQAPTIERAVAENQL